MQKNEKEKNWRKSDVAINNRFYENANVLDLIDRDIIQQHDTVKKAADEEKRLNEIASVDDDHGKKAMVALKINVN